MSLPAFHLQQSKTEKAKSMEKNPWNVSQSLADGEKSWERKQNGSINFWWRWQVWSRPTGAVLTQQVKPAVQCPPARGWAWWRVTWVKKATKVKPKLNKNPKQALNRKKTSLAGSPRNSAHELQQKASEGPRDYQGKVCVSIQLELEMYIKWQTTVWYSECL